MKKDYLWSDTTIDAEAEKQILIYLGLRKYEYDQNTQNNLIFF